MNRKSHIERTARKWALAHVNVLRVLDDRKPLARLNLEWWRLNRQVWIDTVKNVWIA